MSGSGPTGDESADLDLAAAMAGGKGTYSSLKEMGWHG